MIITYETSVVREVYELALDGTDLKILGYVMQVRRDRSHEFATVWQWKYGGTNTMYEEEIEIPHDLIDRYFEELKKQVKISIRS